MTPSTPPAHLSRSTKTWWSEVVSTYELESHHLRVLQAACEAWDRCQQARRAVSKLGLLVLDRYGSHRINPAVNVERDARTAFLRAVRELDLDIEPPATGIRGVEGRR